MSQKKSDEGSLLPDERVQPADDPRSVIVLFALLSIVPFLGVIEGPFLFDDYVLIVQNPKVHALDQVGSWWSGGFWELKAEGERSAATGQYFRPLVLLSYTLDWLIGGGKSWSFHLSNLLYGALSAGLGMAVLLRWLRSSTKAALLAGVIFSLHPSKAESLAWIAGRTDVLLMCGLMLVLLGHAWFVGFDLPLRSHTPRRMAGGILQLVGTLVAYGSKEHAVVLPVFVGVQIFMWRLHSSSQIAGVWPRFLRSDGWLFLGHSAVSVAYLVGRSLLMPFASSPIALGILERGSLLLQSLGRYLQLFLFPYDLSLFAAYQPLSTAELIEGANLIWVTLGALHLVGLGAILVLSWRKRWPMFAPLVLYVSCLLPVSNLVPMGTDIWVSPRFLFVPLMPAGVLVAQWVSLGSARLLNGALVVAVLLGMGSSFYRASHFSSAEGFWRYELARNHAVPSVIGANAGVDRDLRLPLRAAARSACGYERALKQANVGALSRLLSSFAAGVVSATPYDETQQLSTIARWLDQVLAARAQDLSWNGVKLRFGAGRAESLAVEQVRSNLLVTRALLAVRMRHAGSLHFAQLAVARCPTCPDVVLRAAHVALMEKQVDLAQTWLEAGQLLDEPVLDGRSLRQLAPELRNYAQSLAHGDAQAELTFALTVRNDSAAVTLARARSEVIDMMAVSSRLSLARSAHAVGARDVAELALLRVFSGEEAKVVHEELMKISPVLRSPPEPLPRFIPGGCATAEERL